MKIPEHSENLINRSNLSIYLGLLASEQLGIFLGNISMKGMRISMDTYQFVNIDNGLFQPLMFWY